MFAGDLVTRAPNILESLAVRVVDVLQGLSGTKHGVAGEGDRKVLLQARELLDAAIAFCRGHHLQTSVGLSGSYVFSIVTKALDYDGSIDELARFLQEQRSALDRVLENEPVSVSEVNHLFGSINNLFFSMSSLSTSEGDSDRWRL